MDGALLDILAHPYKVALISAAEHGYRPERGLAKLRQTGFKIAKLRL